MKGREWRLGPAIWTMWLAWASGPAQAEEPVADLIVTGGKIVTVDADFTIASALAIRGNRILAVGSEPDVKRFRGRETQFLHLEGATVLPGLIDSHVHATGASMYEVRGRVPAMESVDDVLRYVAEQARHADEGEWISLSQVFITRLRERRFPTRAELDRAAPDHPVVFRTGPDAALNSRALALSGIDREFEVPDGSSARVERDPETGEPTGILRSGGGLIKRPPRTRAPDFEERAARLRKLLRDYNRVGITSIADRNVGNSALRLYETLWRRGELSCRVYLYRGVNARADLPSIRNRMEAAAAHPLHEYDDRLWLRGVKIFLDGGMLTGSAYMLEPWGISQSYGIEDSDYRGMRYVEPDKLYEIAKLALEHDLQITAHAVGDGAVETLVDAYARIARHDFPVREHRPCVTHGNFMSERAIRLMARHGIVADLQPAWLYLDGATLQGHFGTDRLAWFQPYRALFDAGVVVGGGSDHMQKIGSLRSVNPYNPFLGMWTTLTRQPRWMEEPLHPGQRITREEAIRLYTIHNAFLTFEETEKGSLEAGKLADFIVVDGDILTCSLDELRHLEVRRTYVGGELVFHRGAAGND